MCVMPNSEATEPSGGAAPPHAGKTTIAATENTNVVAGGSGAVAYGKHATMPVLASDLYAKVEIPDLAEFDLDTLKMDSTVVAVGKRRTGKSWVFRNIMYHMKDKFPAGIVFSQTDELNQFWRQYIPAKYIYKKYDPAVLDAVFARQKRIINDPQLTDEEREAAVPFFVLLDDVISDSSLRFDSNLMELFVAGRHYKLFVLITTQYAKSITPVLRGNTDFCFMMLTLQKMQRESLWEDYGDFLTKDAFAQIMAAYTEHNEVLVVNNCPEEAVTPLSMLSWFKAIDPGVFNIGSAKYWEEGMKDGSADEIPPAPDDNNGAEQLLSTHDFMPPVMRQYMN
jgi:hypothetical protein